MRGKRLSKKGKIIVSLSIITIIILVALCIILYIQFHGLKSSLTIKLNGKSSQTLEVGTKYKENNAVAKYKNKDISKNIKITNNVNTSKLGTYKVKYLAKYKKVSKSVTRNIKVVDTTKPEIKLEGDAVTIVVGNTYNEPGYSAIDNYDKDITTKVEVTNNIDINKIGEYQVDYKVVDSSKNESKASRKVLVIAKPNTVQKVAVLNYHFFCDSSLGEACNDGNFIDVKDFKQQLDYLKNNNYKALTMKEFRDWMYGVSEIPDKSVLITIDDGAAGTGKHNGNKLIPILEEYKMHATLFLITGWWAIDNYKSNYLEIESHTHDMHRERMCEGVTRGAQMLCNSNEQVLSDLQQSINVTKSKLAFCFPFYAYSDNAISLVKQAGFELAFIGGGYKATRATDKYHIPRYQIRKTTTLDTFINYIS